MTNAGFNLRSWTSNQKELLYVYRQHGNADDNTSVKLLGMKWQPNTDLLSYNRNEEIHESTIHTKREVVRTLSSMYDPLGALLPLQVQAKIFIQKLWQLQIDWDTPLDDNQGMDSNPQKTSHYSVPIS